jgi:hypothetical protein
MTRARANRARPRAALRAGVALGATLVASALLVASAAHGDNLLATRARRAILGLELDRAASLLEPAPDSAAIHVERARLALYRGDCDGAVATLERPELESEDALAELLGVSVGCRRSTAAALVVRDEAHGVVIRFQDDEDQSLSFLLADTAARTRELLRTDLGVELPTPIFIELVRDQLALSAATGLPEEAAQTTGTVGVAKWGRVFMLSPRATLRGYPWLDTLAHELTHLALSQGTLDRAPLWLQEGVAKREESRWREADPFDGKPSADAVAAHGMRRGLGRPLTELGPSIAMLPSPDEAMVAFAQVSSFVAFWVAEAGEGALPRLLVALRDGAPEASIDQALGEVSGAGLAAWQARWLNHLAALPAEQPPEILSAEQLPRLRDASRRVRLAELLMSRGHASAAVAELDQAMVLTPQAPTVRCTLAEAWLAQASAAATPGDQLEPRQRAAAMVAHSSDVHQRLGRWWSLHALLHEGADPLARWRALTLDPLHPAIACEERPVPELPADEQRRALCEAARRSPQTR